MLWARSSKLATSAASSGAVASRTRGACAAAELDAEMRRLGIAEAAIPVRGAADGAAVQVGAGVLKSEAAVFRSEAGVDGVC